MITHSDQLEHLEIPEIPARLHERLQNHRSRYERIVAQHAQMKKEERVRYTKDIVLLISGLCVILFIFVHFLKKDRR